MFAFLVCKAGGLSVRDRTVRCSGPERLVCSYDRRGLFELESSENDCLRFPEHASTTRSQGLTVVGSSREVLLICIELFSLALVQEIVGSFILQIATPRRAMSPLQYPWYPSRS